MRRTILSEDERLRILNLHKRAILLENPIPDPTMPVQVMPTVHIRPKNSNMTITLPSDAPLKVSRGGYEKNDTSLTLFGITEDGAGKLDTIYSFLIQDHPEFKSIANTIASPYSKDMKTWEQDPSNPQKITLHSTNKFLLNRPAGPKY